MLKQSKIADESTDLYRTPERGTWVLFNVLIIS